MPKTIIVGGGLAGLATAVELLDAGIEVELIEKRDVLGGKTSAWQDDAGDHIESGLHCYFRCYRAAAVLQTCWGVPAHPLEGAQLPDRAAGWQARPAALPRRARRRRRL